MTSALSIPMDDTRKPLTAAASGVNAAGDRGSNRRRPISAVPWFRPHLAIMSVVFLGALAIGYLVLPGQNERIAALQRDGKNREALHLLEQLFKQGDRSQRTLFQLQHLYEHFGDLEMARRTLEMLAGARPRDLQVQRQLAQFYKLTQNEAGYVAALKRQLDARYSEPACKELIGIHRRNGRFAEEQAALSDCRQRGYRRTDDVIRLAYLVAADGQIAEASSILRSVDDRRRLKVDRDRLMFFTALVEAGQAVEAQKRALRWLKASRDDALVLLLIDHLAKDGKYELAIDLARQVGAPGDGVSLAVGELLLDQEQSLAARSYLKGWMDIAKIRDVEIAQRFVAAALDAEDPELAFRGAASFGLAKIGQGELVQLAEALSAVGRTADFQSVREAINPATLQDNPLLAAAVELDRGAPEPARELLSRVQVDTLDEWRLALWARLMETAGRRTPALPQPAPVAAGAVPRSVPQAAAPRFQRRYRAPAGQPGLQRGRGLAAGAAAKRKATGAPSGASQPAQPLPAATPPPANKAPASPTPRSPFGGG